MKGCADRQRKRQLLLGGSSHTGGWRVEAGKEGKEGGGGRKFKTLIYQSYKSALVTADIHHSHRRTGLEARCIGEGFWGPFITIFS